MKSTKTRPGNRYLKGVLGIAALSAARSKNTYFAAKYKRIATRRGPMRAIVAIEHAMITAAHNMLTNGDFYRDPAPTTTPPTSPPEPNPEQSTNSNPSATESLCNHSPNPPNPPPSQLTLYGHPIFVSGVVDEGRHAGLQVIRVVAVDEPPTGVICVEVDFDGLHRRHQYCVFAGRPPGGPNDLKRVAVQMHWMKHLRLVDVSYAHPLAAPDRVAVVRRIVQLAVDRPVVAVHRAG